MAPGSFGGIVRTFTADELKGCLECHAKWLDGTGGARADLGGAYLSGADLSDANLGGAKLPEFGIPEGDLTVWKKINGTLVKLLIPEAAKRTASLVGRKCRAEFAKVVLIEGAYEVTSNGCGNGPDTVYRVGEIVRPDSYDDDIRIECSHGIHFFLTRGEAERWSQ